VATNTAADRLAKYPAGQKWENYVRFARFSIEHRIEPVALANLMKAAHTAGNASAKECNVPGSSADRQRKRFEEMALHLHFGVSWNGLWPTLYRTHRRCRSCQDRPGKDGLGRPCLNCNGSSLESVPESERQPIYLPSL
jgi:hypothetical protein